MGMQGAGGTRSVASLPFAKGLGGCPKRGAGCFPPRV